jgi:hypothetical protein
LAERVLGKDEVTGPIPVIGSIRRRAPEMMARFDAMPRRSADRREGGQSSGPRVT